MTSRKAGRVLAATLYAQMEGEPCSKKVCVVVIALRHVTTHVPWLLFNVTSYDVCVIHTKAWANHAQSLLQQLFT